MSYESLCISADGGCWSCALLVQGALKYLGPSISIRVISGARRVCPVISPSPLVITIEYMKDLSFCETKLELYVLERGSLHC